MRAFLAALIVSFAALTVALTGAGCSKEREVAVAFDDTRMGRVEIHGVLHPGRNNKRVLVLVHGLGDDHDAPAIRDAAEAAQALGWATLRMSLRGADKSGQGFYVANGEDIAQAIASAPLAKYETVAVLGFSLGAHNALRYASGKPDPRVKAVVAVSAPLDLEKIVAALDTSPSASSVIASIAAQYRPFHDEMMKRGKLQWLPNPDRVQRFKTVKQFDDEVSGPIAGYKDAATYWAKESAGAHLADLKIPAAIIAGAGDPLVPIAVTRAIVKGAASEEAGADQAGADGADGASPIANANANANIELFEVDGGHITLSPSMTMQQRAPDGLMTQALAWIDSKAAR